MLRVAYETTFTKEQIVRIECRSTHAGEKVLINKNIFCQPPQFTDISVGFLPNKHLTLCEDLSEDSEQTEIELKIIKNRIGIKAVTVTIEDLHSPYEGVLEKLSLNFLQTDMSNTKSTNWAGNIIGQIGVV